jgi:hypothetical protein
LTPPLVQQALDRDRQCIFSGDVPSCDSDTLVAAWVFPPFLGYEASVQYFEPSLYFDICNFTHPNKLSSDPYLETKYYRDPDGCDLSELMVVENVVSGRKDIITLFWENKLGVDVDVRIILLLFK